VTCLLIPYINRFDQVDECGTQQPIALLKLLFERGGFYDRGRDLRWKNIKDFGMYVIIVDRLCGLVVRISGYRSGGPGFNSRNYKRR
jgi:hypothetical protein